MKPPWGMALPDGDQAMFHLILEGTAWLRMAAEKPLFLKMGDLVLLPNGPAHELVHEPRARATPLAELIAGPLPRAFKSPGTTVACGVYSFDASMARSLLAVLPPVLHLKREQLEADPSLSATVALIARELENARPGTDWLVARLFDVLLVYLFRNLAASIEGDASGWLTALRDPALSKVLSRMHENPDAPWTVASLAREASMSRAAFARRFSAGVGEAPLAYLTRWRMGVAARLLRETNSPLAEIAGRVGYESEFAFSRAFKRALGRPPIAFRRGSAA